MNNLFRSRQSLLKRINCFKQQNSEENPLILLNNSNSIGNQALNLSNSKSSYFNAVQQSAALSYNEHQSNQNSDNLNEMYLNQINQGIPMPYLNSNNNNNYMPFNQVVNYNIFLFITLFDQHIAYILFFNLSHTIILIILLIIKVFCFY